eukprot:GHVN01068869.1.p1 GENE.GHVN01068869.1~~GHVN01068869.1.p1  ORF type:complete len:430 (-),score=51.37 GHVN01068869.1:1800-3089(-)
MLLQIIRAAHLNLMIGDDEQQNEESIIREESPVKSEIQESGTSSVQPPPLNLQHVSISAAQQAMKKQIASPRSTSIDRSESCLPVTTSSVESYLLMKEAARRLNFNFNSSNTGWTSVTPPLQPRHDSNNISYRSHRPVKVVPPIEAPAFAAACSPPPSGAVPMADATVCLVTAEALLTNFHPFTPRKYSNNSRDEPPHETLLTTTPASVVSSPPHMGWRYRPIPPPVCSHQQLPTTALTPTEDVSTPPESCNIYTQAGDAASRLNLNPRHTVDDREAVKLRCASDSSSNGASPAVPHVSANSCATHNQPTLSSAQPQCLAQAAPTYGSIKAPQARKSARLPSPASLGSPKPMPHAAALTSAASFTYSSDHASEATTSYPDGVASKNSPVTTLNFPRQPSEYSIYNPFRRRAARLPSPSQTRGGKPLPVM